MGWQATSADCKYGIAICDYAGTTGRCLPLNIGDRVQLLEQNGEWYRGRVLGGAANLGIFPANHIRVRPCTVHNAGQFEHVQPQDDPVALEVVDVLKEWGKHMQKLYLTNLQKFEKLLPAVNDLILLRQQLMLDVLPEDLQANLRSKITNKIDWGNQHLGLDLIPRDDQGKVLTADDTSILHLFRVHETAVANRARTLSLSSVRRMTTTTTAGGAPPPRQPAKHLLVQHKVFVCGVGENVDLFYSIYDETASKFITETFLVRLSKSGAPLDERRFDKMACVFADLQPFDGDDATTAHSLHLVCYAVRNGPMEMNKHRGKNAVFRRPLACGVAPLKSLLTAPDEERNRDIKMNLRKPNEESGWPMMHMHMLKDPHKFAVFDGSASVHVSARVFSGPMQQVRKDNPLVFKNPIAGPLDFSDLIMPEQARNDLYVTVCHASFDPRGKQRPRNIEVIASLCRDDGVQLSDCISLGVGEPAVNEFGSVIYYHNNNPTWQETFKVSIDPEQFTHTHIKFYFRHCQSSQDRSKNEAFCFAFVRLVDAQTNTAIADGKHEPDVFRYQRLYDSVNEGPPPYLTNTEGLERLVKDQFVIRTNLCSTKLTQNVSLRHLLTWRLMPKESLGTVLDDVKDKVESNDIIKFPTDIFDAIFGILHEHPALADKVFSTLVEIIKKSVIHRRYQSFRKVLDAYIERHFAHTTLHPHLVASLHSHVRQAEDVSKLQDINRAMKALEYIFKFIVKSFDLAKKSGQANVEEFKGQLTSLFRSFNTMMELDDSRIIGTQSITLQHFAHVFHGMDKIFDTSELGGIVQGFIQAISHLRNAKLNEHKLSFLNNLVQSPLYTSREGRLHLNTPLTTIISFHLEGRDHLGNVLDIVESILNVLSSSDNRKPDDIVEVASSLLLDLLQVCHNMNTSSPHFPRLVTGLLQLLNLMRANTYQAIIVQKSEPELLEFLAAAFSAFDRVVTNEVYPPDWVVMRTVLNDVILTATKELSVYLRGYFLDDTHFEQELWTQFFRFAVRYMCQKHLQVEAFSETKRAHILGKQGDRRELMAQHVVDMWSVLGSKQMLFSPALVGPFQEMALIPHKPVRRLAIPIFFDMIERDVELYGHFQNVSNEMMDQLDAAVTAGAGDHDYVALFSAILEERRAGCSSDVIREQLPNFVADVAALLGHLLNLRNVPEGDRHRDERAACMIALLHFYGRIGRVEMKKRYVEKLTEIHIQAKQFAEAGLALKLHADLLEWTDTKLEPFKSAPSKALYPEQTERERKAAILDKVVGFLDQGEVWEKAIPICKELAQQYEEEMFDYPKLRDLLTRQAELLNKIVKGQRSEPQYFRVGYWGSTFPEHLRNKEFIYRTRDKNDHITVFCDRIQNQFPTAQLLMSPKPVTEAMRESKDQRIMISKVTPVMDNDSSPFKGKPVPSELIKYYRSNDVSEFRFERPFHKGKQTDNEFATLWTETSTMEAACKLPCEQPLALVVNTTTAEQSPVQNAIRSMVEKNRELQNLIEVHNASPGLNVNPLTMSLQGVLDAAVMGGVGKLRDAFFTEEYIKNNPDDAENVDRLRHLIRQQVTILEAGVAVHGKECPDGLTQLQQRFETLLEDMKKQSAADDIASTSAAETPSTNGTGQAQPPKYQEPPRASVSSTKSFQTGAAAASASSSPHTPATPATPSTPAQQQQQQHQQQQQKAPSVTRNATVRKKPDGTVVGASPAPSSLSSSSSSTPVQRGTIRHRGSAASAASTASPSTPATAAAASATSPAAGGTGETPNPFGSPAPATTATAAAATTTTAQTPVPPVRQTPPRASPGSARRSVTSVKANLPQGTPPPRPSATTKPGNPLSASNPFSAGPSTPQGTPPPRPTSSKPSPNPFVGSTSGSDLTKQPSTPGSSSSSSNTPNTGNRHPSVVSAAPSEAPPPRPPSSGKPPRPSVATKPKPPVAPRKGTAASSGPGTPARTSADSTNNPFPPNDAPPPRPTSAKPKTVSRSSLGNNPFPPSDTPPHRPPRK